MATYKKHELYIITKRLYRLIKNHPDIFTLKKLRGNRGWYNPDTKEIEIDYRGEIIGTIIHEAIHHWYPDWCESDVYEAERNIVNQLSIRQIKNIIKVFADIL